MQFSTCLLVSLMFLHVTAFNNPSMKTWWAKRLLQTDYYVAGRLSTRQMKYAVDAGFKTFLSLHKYVYNSATKGGEVLPSTAITKDIAIISNVTYRVLLRKDEQWHHASTIDKLRLILHSSPTPVVYFSEDPSIAAFTLLLALAKEPVVKTTHQVPMDLFLKTFSGFGFELNMTEFLDLIEDVIGVDVRQNATATTLAIPQWHTSSLWSLRPAAYNWYVTGQITRDLVPDIGEMGFKTIINFRKGVTVNGAASQECVNLLNVKSRTGTYKDGGRQTTARLLETRIDPTKPNGYISANSSVNYESMNQLEYGDSVGYNETMEERHIQKTVPEVEYVLLPVAGRTQFSTSLWNKYKNALLQAQCRGPILAHCSTGYRAAVFGVLALAYVRHHDSEWAFAKCRDVGYDAAGNPPVADMYREVLDSPHQHIDMPTYCIYHNGGRGGGQWSQAGIFTIAVTLLLSRLVF